MEQASITEAIQDTPPAQPKSGNAPATAASEVLPARQTGLQKAPVLMKQSGGIDIPDLDTLWRLSNMIVAAGLAPKGLERVESVAIAIQLGLELGLSPMMALQNIAVINGRPGIYGDAALAIVRASGLLEWIKESYEGAGQSRRAICITKRRGDPDPMRSEFSVDDAKTAKLWGKDGPWTFYPDRMLRFRARGFNLRDNFSDVLKGFKSVEEIGDYREILDDEPAPLLEMPRAAVPEPAPAAAAPESPDAPGLPGVKVVSMKKTRSGTTDGTPWSLFTIKTESGQEYETSSTRHAAEAEKARAGGYPVRIVAAPGEGGVATIETIEKS